MKKTIKRLLSSLIGVSLIISAAGCNNKPSGTTRSEAETTTPTTATETTSEGSTAAEETIAKAENQSFKYRPGDTVTFGKYEQDNNKSNGKEDIEWIVLARDGNKLLLISKMALDQQPYNEKNEDVTWETCSLRKWLNESFYESAFDGEDKGYIVSTNVTADKNPKYETAQGNDTTDKVFLLSIQEFNKYFASVKGIMSFGTKAFYANDKFRADSNSEVWWWLRTSGESSKQASSVIYYTTNYDDNKPVLHRGLWVEEKYNESAHGGGIRPVIWAELPDHYTNPDKHITAWVEGYGTARINYDTSKGQVETDIPNVPCQILYTDGVPSSGGEVRATYGTREAIEDWLKNNVGENVGFGWAGEGPGDDSMIVAGSGRLEKTK